MSAAACRATVEEIFQDSATGCVSTAFSGGCLFCRMERDQDIVIQESELAAGTWMPIEEAAAMPIFASGSFKSVFDACKAYADGAYQGFAANKLINSFNNRKEVLMHGI